MHMVIAVKLKQAEELLIGHIQATDAIDTAGAASK